MTTPLPAGVRRPALVLPDRRARAAAPSGPPPPLPAVRAPLRRRAQHALWRGRLLLVAVCLGLAAGTAVEAVRPAPPATVAVVVPARDVRAGAPLSTADLAVAHLPAGTVPAGTWSDVADADGRTPAVDLPAGQPLTPGLLVGEALRGPPGTVVAPVRLDDPAVAALLAPGLRVDLVAARPEGGAGTTVAARALVLPVPADAPSSSAGLLGGPADDTGTPVLVAVTPDEAVRVAEASATARIVAVVVP